MSDLNKSIHPPTEPSNTTNTKSFQQQEEPTPIFLSSTDSTTGTGVTNVTDYYYQQALYYQQQQQQQQLQPQYTTIPSQMIQQSHHHPMSSSYYSQQHPQQQQSVHPTTLRQTLPRHDPQDVGKPSRVLHVRNVTPDVSQLSLQSLVSTFGKIKSVVLLRQTNQALIEMENLDAAKQIVDYFKTPGYAEVDRRRIFIRFSRHEALTSSGHVSKVLLVSMFNTVSDIGSLAHITPLVVYQLFVSYGCVHKVALLPRNPVQLQPFEPYGVERVQALVQFDSVQTSDRVRRVMQGQPVTLGDVMTFGLDIQFSRVMEVRATNPYTSLSIPEGISPQDVLAMTPIQFTSFQEQVRTEERAKREEEEERLKEESKETID